MNEEDKAEHLTQEVVKEQESKLILGGVKQLFMQYRSNLFGELQASNWRQTKKREEIYRQLKSIDTVEAILLTSIQTGKMARNQLSLMQRATQKARNIVGL